MTLDLLQRYGEPLLVQGRAVLKTNIHTEPSSLCKDLYTCITSLPKIVAQFHVWVLVLVDGRIWSFWYLRRCSHQERRSRSTFLESRSSTIFKFTTIISILTLVKYQDDPTGRNWMVWKSYYIGLCKSLVFAVLYHKMYTHYSLIYNLYVEFPQIDSEMLIGFHWKTVRYYGNWLQYRCKNLCFSINEWFWKWVMQTPKQYHISQNVLCSTHLWCYNLITTAEKWVFSPKNSKDKAIYVLSKKAYVVLIRGQWGGSSLSVQPFGNLLSKLLRPSRSYWLKRKWQVDHFDRVHLRVTV